MQAQYDPIYHGLEMADGRAEARKWLDHRGMLARLPTHEKGKTDDLEFGRKLEKMCGPKANGASVRCIWASGMPFGIVGNEIYAPELK